MANNKEYIQRLRMTVEHLHKCTAVHCATVPVNEQFKGATVWEGSVEVFDIYGHPKTTRAYAWSHREGKNDSGERIVTVLELPPVVSAKTAVQASIMADGQK